MSRKYNPKNHETVKMEVPEDEPLFSKVTLDGERNDDRRNKSYALELGIHIGISVEVPDSYDYHGKEVLNKTDFAPLFERFFGVSRKSWNDYTVVNNRGSSYITVRRILKAEKPSEIPSTMEAFESLGGLATVRSLVEAVRDELQAAEARVQDEEDRKRVVHLLGHLFAEARKHGNETVQARREALDAEAREAAASVVDAYAREMEAQLTNDRPKVVAMFMASVDMARKEGLKDHKGLISVSLDRWTTDALIEPEEEPDLLVCTG